MQALSFKAFEAVFRRGIARIQHISKQGMINTCHMHAYLMCSAGLKLKLHICIVTKAFKHLIMCDSRLSVFLIDGHFLAVIGIPAYGALYGALVILYIATDNAHVYTVAAMVLYLFRYLYMAFIVLADNKGAGGVHVYAMHYTGPYFAVYAT